MTELTDAALGLDVLRRTVGSIRQDQLGYRTPCRDFDVAALAEHVVASVTRISASAGVVVAPSTGGTLARMLHVSQDAVSGWERRGTGGDVPFAGRTMAAADLLGVIGLEFVVHAWDFATAIDETIVVSDELAVRLLALAHRTVTPQSRRDAGFDEPVAVGACSSALDGLLAHTGRNPAARTLLR